MNNSESVAVVFRRRLRTMWIVVSVAFAAFLLAMALLSPWTRDWAHRGAWRTLAWLLVGVSTVGFVSVGIFYRCPACGSKNLGDRGGETIDFSPASCNACGVSLK